MNDVEYDVYIHTIYSILCTREKNNNIRLLAFIDFNHNNN